MAIHIINGVATEVPDAPFDLAAAKRDKLELLKRNAAQALALYRPTTGSLAGHVIQTGRIEDQVRLDQSLSIYRREIEKGNGAVVGARFRTLANTDVLVSYQQGYEIIADGIGGWGKRITHRAWDQGGEIVKASDKATLDAIDVNTGWPSE